MIQELKRNVSKLSSDKNFKHNKWFFKYHLEIVEKISLELCEIHKEADRDLTLIMVWMHDYGKIINFDNQRKETFVSGLDFLTKIGFDSEISQRVINYIEILDRKENIQEAPIEVKIVSSADGAAHLIGPFFSLWWHENSTKEFEELMKDNKSKILKDWNKKIVLPEIRKSFETRHVFLLEQCGEFPERFLV